MLVGVSPLPPAQQARKDEADVKKAEAEAEKAAADAKKATADARRSELTALVPDLSKVEASTLEVTKDVPSLSSALSYRALRVAAESVAAQILPDNPDPPVERILVTPDSDLASADAAYRDVSSGLAALLTSADELLKEVPEETFAAGVDIAAALAGALPHVLSLLSSQRTISTAAVTVGDLAAAAAVVEALLARSPKLPVYHDDFRLLLSARVYGRAECLSKKRQMLVAKKLGDAHKKSRLETELAKLREADPPDKEKISTVDQEIEVLGVHMGLIDSVISAIDAYVTSIRAVPAGGTRSLLASAALYEQLHPEDETDKERKKQAITHVLLVKSEGGQAEQVIDNKPLWFADTFSTVVDVTVTYLLIQTSTSTVVTAGSKTATATAHGKVGEKPTLPPPEATV
jgi:hypothetical protein